MRVPSGKVERKTPQSRAAARALATTRKACAPPRPLAQSVRARAVQIAGSPPGASLALHLETLPIADPPRSPDRGAAVMNRLIVIVTLAMPLAAAAAPKADDITGTIAPALRRKVELVYVEKAPGRF